MSPRRLTLPPTSQMDTGLPKGDILVEFQIAHRMAHFDGEGVGGVGHPVMLVNAPIGEGVWGEGDVEVLGFTSVAHNLGDALELPRRTRHRRPLLADINLHDIGAGAAAGVFYVHANLDAACGDFVYLEV